MCGIVGYIGQRNTKKVILQGLQTLEYRGYDSSGMALISKGEIIVEKKLVEYKILLIVLREKIFHQKLV